jgi:predicted DNA-binding antitoxin AbrB/MazE fold protein
MVIRGRIENGVVALGADISLPEGMEVTVVVPAVPATVDDEISEDESCRIVEIMDEIAAMPDENPGDTFSGADHDQVLYGTP